jgi:hypothetical protein
MMACAACREATTAILARELKPGRRGHSKGSFAGSYDLCAGCLELCRTTRALRRETHTWRKKETVELLGKALQWLRNLAQARRLHVGDHHEAA